jgi:hypothetical protein
LGGHRSSIAFDIAEGSGRTGSRDRLRIFMTEAALPAELHEHADDVATGVCIVGVEPDF